MCLPCAKAAMDGRAAADSAVAKSQLALKKSLDCLQTTVMAAPLVTVSKETEKKLLVAADEYRAAVTAACEAYAKVVVAAEATARANWPPEES